MASNETIERLKSARFLEPARRVSDRGARGADNPSDFAPISWTGGDSIRSLVRLSAPAVPRGNSSHSSRLLHSSHSTTPFLGQREFNQGQPSVGEPRAMAVLGRGGGETDGCPDFFWFSVAGVLARWLLAARAITGPSADSLGLVRSNADQARHAKRGAPGTWRRR